MPTCTVPDKNCGRQLQAPESIEKHPCCRIDPTGTRESRGAAMPHQIQGKWTMVLSEELDLRQKMRRISAFPMYENNRGTPVPARKHIRRGRRAGVKVAQGAIVIPREIFARHSLGLSPDRPRGQSRQIDLSSCFCLALIPG